MEKIFIKDLKEKHFNRVIIWSHSHNKHAIYYTKPFLYFFYANITILDENHKKLEFEKYQDAVAYLSSLNHKKNIF